MESQSYNRALFSNFDINYSKKNIAIPSEKEYITLLISKVENVTSEKELVNEC